jgi:uncharacterized membrane-anchored protein YjiN (DUF445 family)
MSFSKEGFVPHPGAQAEFMNAPVTVRMYGGARGGRDHPTQDEAKALLLDHDKAMRARIAELEFENAALLKHDREMTGRVAELEATVNAQDRMQRRATDTWQIERQSLFANMVQLEAANVELLADARALYAELSAYYGSDAMYSKSIEDLLLSLGDRYAK